MLALVLGFALPFLDAQLGSEWTRSIGFVRATQVDGARAILTTLAGATLGVAGVAFSITIVAVSFASSNYGPRLIGNFMSDRTNQIVLGIFVATFVYCITVLSTVHAGINASGEVLEAFVPQISVYFAVALTLVSVGALIGYIHHIPESINIMNLTAQIGAKLRSSVVTMLEEGDAADREGHGRIDVAAWRDDPIRRTDESRVRTRSAGYLQQLDLQTLDELAREHAVQIVVERAPGDFLAAEEAVLSVKAKGAIADDLIGRLRDCYTLGAGRTDVQDVLFLSDQLVEVAVRALSPGVNDPQTAILCLNWLRAGLVAFARRSPPQPVPPDAAVLYGRVTFETMLDRSFDGLRQHVAADRTVTLHALSVLSDLAVAASRETIVAASTRQMRRLAGSAKELLTESVAREEVAAALAEALARAGGPAPPELG